MHPNITKPQVGQGSPIEDYAEILGKYDLPYRQSGFYYQVGEIEKVQGWILHLSVVWTQLEDLLNTVLPLLTPNNIPFKIVYNAQTAKTLCDGGLGYNKLGKPLCLYPPSDDIAIRLVKKLLEVTQGFHGSSVPTDLPLGGVIFTRYGSFKPKRVLSKSGRIENYIHDAGGKLVKDEYHSPYKVPKGIPWPFGEITPPKELLPSTFLKDSYKIFSTLKTDAKGRVMKSLRLNGLKVPWIIIKEAKPGVFADDQERDNTDRLRWQYELQKSLFTKIPIPEVYDFFEENGNSYLVMEYIKGKLLAIVVAEIYKSSAWFDLDLDSKLQLLDHLIQLIDTIRILHEEGYMHRDINPINFILDKKGRFVAIDLELAYSIDQNKPFPPFTLGTPGYMSPEQEEVQSPKPDQDVYSLGALMIYFFTNLNPNKFEGHYPKLADDLCFFIRNKTISRLISTCLSPKPAERPTVKLIKAAIEDFRDSQGSIEEIPPIEKLEIDTAITGLIRFLNDSTMAKPGMPWHSNADKDNDSLANLQSGITHYIGFEAGMAGTMFVLSCAKSQGYEVEAVKDAYLRSWQYIQANFISAMPKVIPGLYYGAAGVALCIARGIESGLISAEHGFMVQKCLEIPSPDLSIADGVAGQGLAVLGCKDLLAVDSAKSILERCINPLLEHQQKDGSWSANTPDGKRIGYTGFSQGTAGICYFLLKYYKRYEDERVKPALLKSLKWLKKQSKRNKDGIFWWKSNQEKVFDSGLNNGTAGIALCFIKAYQVLGDLAFKKIAEDALQLHPQHMVYPIFSWADGVAGLAEVYLVAAKVLDDSQWKERADFIVNTLLHVRRRKEEDSCYWITEDDKNPTADFMVGNSGILHLLLHYNSPNMPSFF